jgi:hypothetical protein
MYRAYVDEYVVCEQPDGWFRVQRGERELPERFATERAAQQHVAQLIGTSGGRREWDIKYWTGACPNCNVRDSLRIARTGGAVVHMCGQPDWRCSYVKNVGPMPGASAKP